MQIYELDPNTREITLDGGSLKVKKTIIKEQIEGEILYNLSQKLCQINCNRFKNFKKEVNTIAMSCYLYKYIEYLMQRKQYNISKLSETKIKELFGLKIVVRDDYEIDEIDFYRDITEEI